MAASGVELYPYPVNRSLAPVLQFTPYRSHRLLDCPGPCFSPCLLIDVEDGIGHSRGDITRSYVVVGLAACLRRLQYFLFLGLCQGVALGVALDTLEKDQSRPLFKQECG